MSTTTSSTAVNKDKCTCCQHSLIRKDKVGIVTLNFPKCKDCKGKICRSCMVKNRCHECIIKEKLKNRMIPDILMTMDRDELLIYIEQLHYPKDHFKTCETKYLVKQILVRYGVGKNWDPRFHNETLDSTVDGRDHRRTSIATESDISPKHQVKHRRHKEPSIDWSMGAELNAAFERHFQEQQITHNQQSSFSEDTRLRTSDGTLGKMQAGHTHGLKESVEEKGRHHKAWVSHQDPLFSLLDVTTPAYFDNLGVVELRAILKQHSLPSDSYKEKHEFKFAVLRLWNDLKAQAPPRPVQHKHQQHKRMTDVVKTLHDISLVNATEDLSTAQMIQLMINHHINVKADIEQHELIIELKRMWHEAKQSHQLQQQVHKQERTPSLGDIRSACDLGNLTANQLLSMLSNNGIDPRQYPEVHEMRYMVSQLWYRTQKPDYSSNDHDRSMESHHTIDDRYRASKRHNNLQKGKPSSTKCYLDDSTDTTSDSGYQHLYTMYAKQMYMPLLAVSLTDVRQPEDIQDLSVAQFKSILSSNQVEFSCVTDKAEMAWKVKELWVDKKAQESENQHRLKGHPQPYYCTSAFTPVDDMPPPPPPLSPIHYDHMLPNKIPPTLHQCTSSQLNSIVIELASIQSLDDIRSIDVIPRLTIKQP